VNEPGRLIAFAGSESVRGLVFDGNQHPDSTVVAVDLRTPYAVNTDVITQGGAMLALKITKVGNSAAVVLPKELLASLHLQIGDAVFAVQTPDGIRLTPYDPEVEEQMAVMREGMRTHRGALRELAK
jgi:putative addiction module antidote